MAGDRPLYYLPWSPQSPPWQRGLFESWVARPPYSTIPICDWWALALEFFLGGGVGYVTWEGTQHFPLQKRLPNDTPIGPSATPGVNWGCQANGGKMGPGMLLQKLWTLPHAGGWVSPFPS